VTVIVDALASSMMLESNGDCEPVGVVVARTRKDGSVMCSPILGDAGGWPNVVSSSSWACAREAEEDEDVLSIRNRCLNDDIFGDTGGVEECVCACV
jgi:hypothetical protein